MPEPTIHAVTGAFGYSGRYIAQRLLDAGHEVLTLTNSPQRETPFRDRIAALPFHFDRPDLLAAQLRNVAVLYNTYWVRFNHEDFRHAEAVRQTRALFDAARQAGVQRIVHVSITNPALDSPWEYFRGKARLEKALVESGVSYAILRPAVLFGKEDILINNIAWMLRRLPMFGVFGDGQYRLRPIYVDDLAALAVQQGQRRDNAIINAVGPESLTYRQLVEEIGRRIGRPRKIVSVKPGLGYAVAWTLGQLLGDIVITRDEIAGLMAGLLDVAGPATGPTALTAWIDRHAATLGQQYTSELRRRQDRRRAYASN